MPFTRLTSEDGLGNNSVQCILQGRDGIMWIGTNGGLNRYDGAAFIQYNILSKPALSSNVITALLEDDAGNIWIGTDNGLDILDPVTNTILLFSHSDLSSAALSSGPVKALQKMKDGSIWILSATQVTAYTLQNGFRRVRLDSSLLGPTKVFTGLTPNGAQRLWVSYLDQPAAQVARYTAEDGNDSIGSTGLSWPGCSRAYSDSLHQDWGISYFGIIRYDETTGRFKTWLTNNSAQKIPDLHLYTCYCADAEGNIWEGSTQVNLVKYDIRHRQTIDYSGLLQSCNATIVYCIYKDYNNTLWVGTDNGIIRLSNHNFLFTPIRGMLNGREQAGIRCRKIAADRNGVLYAGTESHGLLQLKDSSDGYYSIRQLSAYGAFPVSSLPIHDNRIVVPLNGHFDIGFIYDMWYDSSTTLWLAGYGLGRFDTRTSTLNIFLAEGDDQMRPESITQYDICRDDSLFWLSGQYNVFIFNIAGQRMRPFTDRDGHMPFHGMASWCVVKKGRWIWVGTEKGLYKIDRFTRGVSRENADPALGLCINAIHIDKDSSFWISTAGGGVVHYNTETGQVQQYTTDEGLSNNMVCGILPDKDNNLWVSTYSGLNCLNPQTGQISTFYAKDGLNMNEFNRKAFTKLADGRLVFGGLNGYVVFDPAEILKFNKPASLLLTRFGRTTANGTITDSIFGIQTIRDITIGPESPFFSLTYTFSDMYDPARNEYFYKMDGLDSSWHAIGNQHTLSFMSLPAGKYTLRIKGRPAHGLTAGNTIMIGINVQQKFYKRPWFLILSFLAAAFLCLAVMQYRMAQWRKLHQLRTSIASDLHDEVGGNLVRIALLAEADRNGAVAGTPGERLETIADISRGAASTIRDVVWSIDARNDTLTGMLGHMHEHLHQMLAPAGIEYLFNSNGVSSDDKLKMEFRQNIYRIFREAINNIVKHAGATLVEVEVRRAANLFMLTIKDNGHGMKAAGSRSGQGLSNMQMRADRIGGQLQIDSGGAGVTISLTAQIPKNS